MVLPRPRVGARVDSRDSVLAAVTAEHFLDWIRPRCGFEEHCPGLEQGCHDGGIIARPPMPAVLGAVRRPAERRGVEVVLGVFQRGIRSEQGLDQSEIACQAAQCNGVPRCCPRAVTGKPASSIRRTACVSLLAQAWAISLRSASDRCCAMSGCWDRKEATVALSWSQQAAISCASKIRTYVWPSPPRACTRRGSPSMSSRRRSRRPRRAAA